MKKKRVKLTIEIPVGEDIDYSKLLDDRRKFIGKVESKMISSEFTPTKPITLGMFKCIFENIEFIEY